MYKILFKIVQAVLCPSFVATEGHFSIDQVTEKLYAKIMGMPTVLRAATIMVAYIFNWYGVFISLSLYKNQNLFNCQKQLSQWQDSNIGPCRDVMAFFTKMTFFIYFSLCPKKN